MIFFNFFFHQTVHEIFIFEKLRYFFKCPQLRKKLDVFVSRLCVFKRTLLNGQQFFTKNFGKNLSVGTHIFKNDDLFLILKNLIVISFFFNFSIFLSKVKKKKKKF